jgi:hypothetical protein
LYAIGEIVLVGIGILIALQINNWNEARKLQEEEHKLLQSLKKEIENNLMILNDDITDNKKILANSTKLIKLHDSSEQKQVKVDVVLEVLGYNTNKTETSILNEILNTNSRSLISNDSLLIQLKSLKAAFENNTQTQFYADEFWNTAVIRYMNEAGLGVYWPSFKSFERALNFIEVDQTFYSLVGIMNAYQQSLLFSRKDLQDVLKNTLRKIEEYIKT